LSSSFREEELSSLEAELLEELLPDEDLRWYEKTCAQVHENCSLKRSTSVLEFNSFRKGPNLTSWIASGRVNVCPVSGVVLRIGFCDFGACYRGRHHFWNACGRDGATTKHAFHHSTVDYDFSNADANHVHDPAGLHRGPPDAGEAKPAIT
jgi:hypothetical protein